MITKLGRGLLSQISLIILVAFCAIVAHAEDPATAFDAANKLYEEGRFSDAAAAYEKLLSGSPGSSALYFNLGNAWFKSGQIGHAIMAYRQAERLSPRDPDVRANLLFARNLTQGPSLSASRFERWLGKLSLNEWTLLTSAAVWPLLLLLAAWQLRTEWRLRTARWIQGFSVASFGLCVCLAAAWHQDGLDRSTVIVTRDVVARHGPLDESSNAFTVHDGAELRVLDRKDEWLEVSDGHGRTGWLRRDSAGIASRS